MSDITELEQRITEALERIGTGVDGLASAAVAAEKTAEVADLNQALEIEKAANAQLEERVNAIKAKQETTIARLEEQVVDLDEKLAAREGDCKRLGQVNAQLRDNNAALREANENGVGDAGLINTGIQGELDSLRATRAAEMGEMKAIIDELEPLIGEGA